MLPWRHPSCSSHSERRGSESIPGKSARHRVVRGALCLLLTSLAAPLSGQDSVLLVPDVVICDDCVLDVFAVVELGDREGPGILGEQAHVARSDDGDYYVSSVLQRGRLLRFSSAGVFQDAIGRTGEGPGEYTWPVLLRGSSDDLSVLDIGHYPNRLTTIRAGEVTTWDLPFVVGTWAVLPDGRHVYSAASFSPDLIGYPVHVYDEAGRRITRSLGDEGVRVDRSPRSRGVVTRRVAVAEDGNIWAAHETRYRIDKWSPDGDRLVRIERDSPWFQPWEVWPGMDYEVRPPPVTVGVGDWGEGLLMVVVRLADANWKPIRPSRTPLPGHETIMPAQENELYDTMIEVLDIRSGTVLGRTQVDGSVVGLVGRDGFYSYAEHSELGEAKYIVWSVALSGYHR